MRIIFNILAITFTLLLSSCRDNIDTIVQPDLPSKQIVILYENDVHCSVDGYSYMPSLRNNYLAENNYVSTVSCGDFASGGLVGAVSNGEKIVDIINYVNYDVITIGNHELDYGMEHMFNLTNALDAPVVCANLKNIQTNSYEYPAYHIISYGKVDVAYIGFTTTTSGTPTHLSDEQGNPLYSFMRNEFYQNAQHFINEARKNGADYVIALSHLGDSQSNSEHPSSINLIENTTGLNAVIDGHDHHIIEEQFVNNKNGSRVLLTSSGANFENIGKLTIDTDGTFHSSLINIASGELTADNATQQYINTIKDEVESFGNFVVGYSDTDLKIYDDNGTRIIRNQEANIGDFCADAFRIFTNADIALINGGGIRDNIEHGEILFNHLLNVMPFGNMVTTCTLSGQQLLDILEFSVSYLPDEDGTFMQVSGLRFNVNPNIPSPAVKDSETDLFSYVKSGERRVSNLQILDKESGKYKDVEPLRQYTMASLDYLILEAGGDGIFQYVKPNNTYWGSDIEVLQNYIEIYLHGNIGSEYNLPQGRITIE